MAAVPTPDSPVAERWYRRHAGLVRITHWINVVCFTLLLMSGLQIFNAVWSRKWNLPFIGYEHLARGGRVRKCETQAFRVIRSLMRQGHWRADKFMTVFPTGDRQGGVNRKIADTQQTSPEISCRSRRHIMCDRYGCTHLPNFKNMDLSGAGVASRRSFLRGAAAATTITMAAGPGLFAGGPAWAAGSIKGTHGTGFCNLNIFLAHSRQYAKAAGVELEFINTPTFAEQVTFLGMGQVDIGLMPYTSFMALYDAGAPVKIVAGGGIEGCAIVAQPGLDSPEKLKGKTLGTFQLDTLEVMPYDYLKKHKIAFKDVKVRYMGNTPEAVEAFKAGALDWICTIEPYASALVADVKGAVMLTDGIDLYGKGYTDCVLAARASLMKDNPAGLKAIIKGMMQAQLDAETQPDEVLKELVGKYYKTSIENARIAQGKQPAVVDARSQTDFILQRTDSVMEMGYIKKKPGRDAIDWTLLEEVIKENPELYGKLKYKSAA